MYQKGEGEATTHTGETEGGAKKAKDCDNVAGERRRGADNLGGRDKLSREVNVLGSLLAASKKSKALLVEIQDLFIMCHFQIVFCMHNIYIDIFI